MRTLQVVIKLLNKSGEVLSDGFDGDKTVTWRRTEKVAKFVATCYVPMKMCIRKTIPVWCTPHISVLDLSSAQLCRTSTERSEKSFSDDTEGKEMEWVFPLDPFFLVCVGI